MRSISRTANSLRNAKVALLFYALNLVIQFFSRKVFIDCLGSEVLGLNTTAQNLLGFLNLAELGIGTAVAYSLYKPLFNDDRQAINDIVSIQGWLYRRIACVVVVGASVLMFFFPLIFAKANVPLWYTYGSFIALLISALLGYFVNYRQIVLSADQKEYKVTYAVQGTKLVKVLSQMLAIYLLAYGYTWWMVLEVVFAVVTSVVLNRIIKKEYPWLCPSAKDGKRLRLCYPNIMAKTKQVFFHRIGSFVLSQTTPLVIYGYASLTLVAIYGNYMLIVTGVMALMTALLNGLGAGVGNLVAEGNNEKVKVVYWKITILRMWLASVICFGMYMLGDTFISFWLGRNFLMPRTAFIILIAITFMQITRTNDVFLAAYGLFQDVWAPLVEAVLNLGLSVLLGYFFGLTGILTGVLISLVAVVWGWKSYFLYRNGFNENAFVFFTEYAKIFIVLGLGFLLFVVSFDELTSLDYTVLPLLVFHQSLVVILYGCISIGLISYLNEPFRKFLQRILFQIISRRVN